MTNPALIQKTYNGAGIAYAAHRAHDSDALRTQAAGSFFWRGAKHKQVAKPNAKRARYLCIEVTESSKIKNQDAHRFDFYLQHSDPGPVERQFLMFEGKELIVKKLPSFLHGAIISEVQRQKIGFILYGAAGNKTMVSEHYNPKIFLPEGLKSHGLGLYLEAISVNYLVNKLGIEKLKTTANPSSRRIDQLARAGHIRDPQSDPGAFMPDARVQSIEAREWLLGLASQIRLRVNGLLEPGKPIS